MKQIGPWRRLSRQPVYENRWIRVHHDEVIDPGGEPGIYGVVDFQHVAVGVLALDQQERILMVRQYRYALAADSLEIPEGGAPAGEDTLDAAKRELAEETGYHAEHWQPWLEMDLSNSVSNERAVIYLATGAVASESRALESTEADLSLQLCSPTELFEAVDHGEIRDAMTVAALLKLRASWAERA